MPERLVSTFTVEAEDGRRWLAHEYRRIVTSHLLAGRTQEALGSRRFALDDGRHLNPVAGDPDAFQIFDTDEVVRKIG